MQSIEKMSIINSKNLNSEFYFQSLLEEAYRVRMISEEEVIRIQYQCLDLLKTKANSYTGGDSSIRIEVAQNIMTSNIYTIGIWLKTYSCDEEAVQALKNLEISKLYANGRNQIDKLVEKAKLLHSRILKNIVALNNYFYSATVIDGIEGFFKLYNPEYAAHEIHITADYPLCNSIKNLAGIEFIIRYLEFFNYENDFCKLFLPEAINQLLYGYDESHQDLVFNIYESVLTTAIGCILTKSNVQRLELSEIDILFLNDLFKNKSNQEIKNTLLAAFADLKREVSLKNYLLGIYIKESLTNIVPTIIAAMKKQMLEQVFLISKASPSKQKVYYSYGEKMDNKQYRKIIDEITRATQLSDKVSIINNKIKSFADLEDIIFDAELSYSEIMEVLNEIGLTEIAVFSKKYPFEKNIDMMELRDQEILLRECLHDFIISLTEEKQAIISTAINVIEIKL